MRRTELAWVAQLVERVLGKDEVTGSIPVPGSRGRGCGFFRLRILNRSRRTFPVNRSLLGAREKCELAGRAGVTQR